MPSPYRTVGKYLSMGFLLPVNTLVGYIIGYFLDRAFGTHFLYLVFLLLGIAAGFTELIRELRKAMRDEDR